MFRPDFSNSQNKLPSAYAAILCGGKSHRFGTDKALMTLDGVRVIDLLASTLSSIFPQVFFISNIRDKFHFLSNNVVTDEIPEQGPLGGIYTALGIGKGDYCFITACDTPFLPKDIVQHLWGVIDDDDMVVPQSQGLIEPLIGFYACRCREEIGLRLQNGQRQTRAFGENHRVRLVNLDGRYPREYLQKAFWNINTATDLAMAQQWYLERYA